MAIFTYTAKGADRRVVKGQLVANDEAGLAAVLKLQNLTLTSAKPLSIESKSLADKFEAWQGVPAVQKIFFTQNLGVMLRGGFSISRAMATLALQTNHRYFRRVILSLQSELEGGMSFSLALQKFPHVFPELFTNMIAAGELGGKLDEVLAALTIQMKKDHQLISKVRGAMTYPIVVVVTMIGAGIAMVAFVVPKLAAVFESNNATLPLPTRILIFISDLFRYQWYWMILGLIVLVVLFVLTGRTKGGQNFFDSLLLHAPIAGPIIRKINLARFTRTLSSMLATDIPIIQTLQVIGRTMSSVHFRHSIDESGQALRSGESIAKVLGRYPKLYPPLVLQMINVGEESGTLDEVSAELATFFEEEVDQTMSNLSTIIEPVILLLLGGAVAGMALAIMLPIYTLGDQIK